MYEDDDKTKLNKKAGYLLFALGIFGFLCFKFTKVNLAKADTKNPESCVASTLSTAEATATSTFFTLSSNEISDVTPEKTTTTVVGNVLGATCGTAQNTYEASSTCSISSNKISVNGSGMVSSNAEVKLVSASIPYVLLAGKYSIKDSNRLITLSDYVYKPAGQFFTTADIERTTTPGEGHESVVNSVVKGSIKKAAYSTKYTVSTGGGSGTGEVIIDKYIPNDCEQCNNPSNTNPSFSNDSAKYLKSINWSYPGEENEVKSDSTSSVAISSSCSNVGKLPVDTSSPTSCINIWNALVGTFSSLFPSTDWTKCAAGGEDCVKAEDIAIKMSPMFSETNSYTELRNKIAADPVTASSYEPTYIITKCIASIGGKLSEVKCVWDLQYLFDDVEFAQYKDAGKLNTPTKEQYMQFLQQESATRAEPLVSM